MGVISVAYGTHPDTGKQYEWIIWFFNAPLHIPRYEFLVVTPTKLREFAQAAAGKLAEWGYCDVTVTDAYSSKRARNGLWSGSNMVSGTPATT